jgi:ADP-ribose pyrophosphatase YjhB (NUDIX family)
LLVEETVGGHLVLNQPAGHLEPDEALVDAACRETLEETGWTVRPTAFVGAYQWKSPGDADGRGGRHYLRVAIVAEPVSHDPARPLDTGIARALWLTPAELEAEAAAHAEGIATVVLGMALADAFVVPVLHVQPGDRPALALQQQGGDRRIHATGHADDDFGRGHAGRTLGAVTPGARARAAGSGARPGNPRPRAIPAGCDGARARPRARPA